MAVILFSPSFSPLLHGGEFGPDEFIIAAALVVLAVVLLVLPSILKQVKQGRRGQRK